MTSLRTFPAAATALAAVLFAIFLLLGFASVDPLREATDAELLEWWTDSGNQRDMAMSMYFVLASCAAFLVFLVGLRSRLAEAEDGSAPLATLVFVLGLAFAVAMLVGSGLRGGLAQSVAFDGEPLPGPQELRILTSLSFNFIGVIGFGAAGLTLLAAAWAILKTKAVSAWVGWSALAVGAVILVAVPFLMAPWLAPLLQLWAVAAGVEIWRTSGRTARVEAGMPVRSAV